MKRFQNSELFFMTLGTSLIMSSVGFLHFDFSLAKFLKLNLEHGDPFQASYSAPPLPASTPPPSVTAPTPVPNLDPPEASIFLTFPANQAILTKMGNRKKGYPIRFKFEVYPKFTASTFELLYLGKVVITKEVKGTASGNFEIKVLLRKSGLYQWRIKTFGITSELRTMTIHD